MSLALGTVSRVDAGSEEVQENKDVRMINTKNLDGAIRAESLMEDFEDSKKDPKKSEEDEVDSSLFKSSLMRDL